MSFEAFTFADWQAGKPYPKNGWDCADAIADGWTKQHLDAFMRATAKPWSPPTPDKTTEKPASERPTPAGPSAATKAAKPVAEVRTTQMAVQTCGADGVSRLSPIQAVVYGSEVEIARILASRLSDACGGRVVKADGKFWAFGPTAWREIPDLELRRAVHRFDGAGVGNRGAPLKVGKRMIDGVLSEAGTILGDPGFFDAPTVGVNALNGVVSVGKDGSVAVRPHDPDDRFRFTVNAGFYLHTDMEPPKGSLLHKLIHGAFKDDPDAADKMHLVSEILGAAAFGLATRLPQPKAFVFLGETASNGKSTVAGLLSCLLPVGSVSSIPPAAFGDERRIVNLAGKVANVADELSAAAISGETFKAAVTGNPIEGRDLYRSAVTFVPRALHCFTTNTLPRFTGGLDRGLQRRLMVLRFNRPIPEKEIIPDIAERIQREELELLLGFAIAGAQRLRRNGTYTIPASSKEALQGWLLLDPVNEWFEARIVATTDEPVEGWPGTGKLFADFKHWALEHGHSERFLPPVNTFSQRLKALPGIQIRRRSSGSVATGIRFAEMAGW